MSEEQSEFEKKIHEVLSQFSADDPDRKVRMEKLGERMIEMMASLERDTAAIIRRAQEERERHMERSRDIRSISNERYRIQRETREAFLQAMQEQNVLLQAVLEKI